jgi:signal transduction histidine kinase/ActR/RegA family two-component response regulator
VTDLSGERLERRLLILAPIGKDASLIEARLRHDDVECLSCPDLGTLLREIGRGAAAILVGEEAVEGDLRLTSFLARQPAWSDLPVLLLTRQGADSTLVERATTLFGNVTLLERPVRVVALISTIRAALRARARQYQTRAYFHERDQADRRKDEFLATLAHELRNPLAPIRNWVNVLRMSGGGAGGEQVWDMMDRQVNHMVRLVDDLMELSRITRGKIELRMELVDLVPVIHAAVETSRPLIDSAGHTLTVSVPPEPIVVRGDAVRLSQVLANLINNAVKYTEPGGTITLVLERVGRHALVSVKDTGIGISPSALPRVFDMFVQLDGDQERVKAGLGIGLTLVRSLVEMHNGRVDARSQGIGKGSEFVVRIPLATGAPAAESRENADVRFRGQTRVLVVDDNEDAADSLGALLRVMGADVRVAHDGMMALEIFREFQPVAVFLDLGMPDMDGFEVARRIKQLPGANGTELIALTGWSQERDRRRSRDAGFTRHLAKPADFETLMGVLLSLETSATP